jgi:hypothetical protein
MLLRNVLHGLGRNIRDVLARDEDQLILGLVGVLPNADTRTHGEDLVHPNVRRLTLSADQLAAVEGKGQTDRVRNEMRAMIELWIVKPVATDLIDVLA